MSLIASDTQRLSNWLKHEYQPSLGFCRKTVTVYEAAAATYVTGTVLQRTLVSGVATAAAVTGNTGNGTMGAVTVYPSARAGVYKLTIVATASNAGVFVVTYPDGSIVGYGNVAAAFADGGISFTLADGSTDFAVGDAFTISMAGTEKYSKIAANGDDSSAVVYVSDVAGNAGSQAIAATTDTTVVVLWQGPAIVADGSLIYGTTVNTAAEKAAVNAVLEAKGILIAAQV